MAKKTESTVAKPAPKTGTVIEFGAWLATARARNPKGGDDTIGELVKALKADKKITVESKLVNVRKRYGDKPGFDVIVARYEGFAKRGSMAGKRSRKAA